MTCWLTSGEARNCWAELRLLWVMRVMYGSCRAVCHVVVACCAVGRAVMCCSSVRNTSSLTEMQGGVSRGAVDNRGL
jgi:hypothetical protein